MRFFFRKCAPKPTFDSPLVPEVPFFAVGDVHGCLDLLLSLLHKLGETGHPDAKLILVGDYVDRGEQSREVLELLQSMQSEHPGEIICLMGNHERMLLDFLDDPVRHGPRWLATGGLQTLASYRIAAVSQNSGQEAWVTIRDKFREALGPTEKWLRELPLIWRTGNVAVVHAAAQPSQPIGEQDDKVLLWGHRDFAKIPRGDGIWVVHGHTITDCPQPLQGRIALDTGAYATGRLTAALVEQGSVRFF
ncbi:metallophosphoesterase [Puniceibacterium sediminis]|uniref:Serine/threonine protein phosphatase 1 n=1 Tax=Puniceibacterium sediminis TaxID=1608407 RepID=A0A238WUU9_9RHOB|nr:metallophosphoesterase [Puniceibacterium sediminis]SNR50168.1 serine/threonine protein phosphatase 1 [Puniceibacterium sediminis]